MDQDEPAGIPAWATPPEFRPEPQDGRDLEWFFGLGANVKRKRLTPKQRRRYDRIASCLAGRGRRLCLYYTNPKTLRDRRLAAIIDEPDAQAALSRCLETEFCNACNRFLKNCTCLDWRSVDIAKVDRDRDREHRMVFGYLAIHAVYALRTEYARYRRARIKIERRGRGRRRAVDVRDEARRNAAIVITFNELAGALANGRETLQAASDIQSWRAAASVTHWFYGWGDTVFWLVHRALPETCARRLIREGLVEWATWGGIIITLDNARTLAERWFVDVAPSSIVSMTLDEMRALFVERSKLPRVARVIDQLDSDPVAVDRYTCPSCNNGEIVDAGKAATAACPVCKKRFTIERLQWLDAKAALRHAKDQYDRNGSRFFRTMENLGLETFQHRGRQVAPVLSAVPYPEAKDLTRDLCKGYTTLSAIAEAYRPLRHTAVEQALIAHGIMAFGDGIPGGTLKRKRLPLKWFATEQGREFAKEMERRRALASLGGHFSGRYTRGANDWNRTAFCPSAARPRGR